MAITRFEDLPSTNTPINSANLNGNFDELGTKVGTSVDNNYRVNVLYSNLLNNIQWEQGTISGTTGALSDSTTRIRTGVIKVNPSTTHTINMNTSYGYGVIGYSSTEASSYTETIKTAFVTGINTFTTGNNTNYIRIVVATGTNWTGAITPNAVNLMNAIISLGSSIVTPSINVDGEEIFPKYNGIMYANDFKCKNMFNKIMLVQGDITGGSTNVRMNSRQVLWLEAGTYTFSTNLGSSYQFGIQVQNIGIPPLSSWPSSFIYTSDWKTAGTTQVTFTLNSAGWFTLMLKRADNGTITNTDINNIQGFNYQLEKGSEATSYTEHKEFENEEVYSTNEQRIGAWLGKPLYRKTFIVTDMGTVSAGSFKNVNTGLTNINIKKLEALEIYTTGGQEYTRTIPNTIGISSVVTTATGSAIRVYPESNSITANSTVNVIIEYTKVSD